LKEGDVVAQFDGERVRSARQFIRLVQETPEGRSVRMAILRDGQQQTLEATLENRSTFSWDPGSGNRDRFNFNFEDLPRRFDFRLPAPGSRLPGSRGRLGVTVQSMTPELEEYFGAKNGGVLVSSVTQDSPAAKAGLKAGDVITAIDGDRVEDSGDLVRELNDATSDDVTISLLRDKKEMTLKASITRRSTGV
jgi:serine protease Do